MHKHMQSKDHVRQKYRYYKLALRLCMVRLSFQGLHKSVRRHGFRPFDWQTQGTVPNQRSENAESSRNTEQHGVVIHFRQSIILKTGVFVKHPQTTYYIILPEEVHLNGHQHLAMGSSPFQVPVKLVAQLCKHSKQSKTTNNSHTHKIGKQNSEKQ